MVKIVDKDLNISTCIEIFKILIFYQYDEIAYLVERQEIFVLLSSSSLRRGMKICASSNRIAGNTSHGLFWASVYSLDLPKVNKCSEVLTSVLTIFAIYGGQKFGRRCAK